MNTAQLSFYQVCRLCLLELNGSSFVPIFDNKETNVPQKIKACFNISVEETDRLPNVLCSACARDVDRFYKFKEKVIKNNTFLKSFVLQRDKKAAQFLNRGDDTGEPSASPPPPPVKSKRGGSSSSAAAAKGKRPQTKSKSNAYQETPDNPLNNYDNCDLSNSFFDNSNKVKVEIIPQVDNDMYSGNGAVYSEIKNHVVEMWSSSPTEESTSGFRTIKAIEEARAVASITDPSDSKSPDYTTSVIRHSSDDYGNGSSSYDKYISVHVKEEICKDDNGGEDYDSEDTKSAASLTFQEEEDKLIIDEETMEVRQYVNVQPNETLSEDVRTSDNCILLRTLISTSNANQIVQSTQPLRSGRISGNPKKPATFSPQILVSEMASQSPTYQQSSPHGGDSTPNSEKSSTRRKQRCPIKAANDPTMGIIVGDESDEENTEVSNISEQHPIIYQQEIVNISPVTVTCSSNGREEIVGYNQTQFLDEVLSRHSSPATTPPMVVPSQAERLHKACDVLLRAASKIQDLPPGIQQEEVVVEEEESITVYTNSSQEGQGEPITIRHNPVPLYEINFSSVNAALNEANRPQKKVKSREKVQNNSTHKECNNCHAVQTTIWRRDRFGNIVCNACGLYYKLHNYDRPCRMRRDEIHKRNRKRNANENKAKKVKRPSNGNYELDSSREQDNSSGSYTPPANYNESAGHVSMSDLYDNPLNTSGGSGIKKRRRTSAPSNTTTVTVKEEQLEIYPEQEHELQSHIDNVEEISVNGTEVVEETLDNHVYEEQQQEKLSSMSAFQLSTHFVPINGKVYEDEFSEENSMSETPLNLAAGSQISN